MKIFIDMPVCRSKRHIFLTIRWDGLGVVAFQFQHAQRPDICLQTAWSKYSFKAARASKSIQWNLRIQIQYTELSFSSTHYQCTLKKEVENQSYISIITDKILRNIFIQSGETTLQLKLSDIKKLKMWINNIHICVVDNLSFLKCP